MVSTHGCRVPAFGPADPALATFRPDRTKDQRMPRYDYACTNPECGNRFELVQAFTDPAASECPVCHQAVRKVYGSVGVVFKGSGFYRNDSRSASVTSESGGSSSDSKSESSSKSDSTST